MRLLLVTFFLFLSSVVATAQSQLNVNGDMINVPADAKVSVFGYGQMKEFLLPVKPERPGLEFNRILVVDGEVFYINTKHPEGMKVYSAEQSPVNLDGLVYQGGDEARNASLLRILIKGFDEKASNLSMYMISFGLRYDCNDCWNNRQCRLWTRCDNYCNWQAGYKCCKNEYGTDCNR